MDDISRANGMPSNGTKSVVTNGSDKNTLDNTNSNDRSKPGVCGYGAFHPNWLQALVKPKVFIATLCCFSFIQGYVINGLNNGNTTTYEKRFFLRSSEAGAISSTTEFAAGLLVIPITYFGAHVHKPRALAVMALVFGFGSFVMLLPHVISDNYDYGQKTTDICDLEGNQSHCAHTNDASLPKYLYVFCTGMVIHGIASTTLYSIGTASIDECVTRESASLALGLFFATGALGPALGFILGGQFLKIYVDADVMDTGSLDFDELDPRWVGAWWIGCIISVVLSCLVALALFAFPRDIPVSEEVLKSRIDQSQEATHTSVGNNVRDLPRATLNLLKNMSFMFTTFASVTDSFIVMGLATFAPKILEQQFNKSAPDANLVFGAIVVVGGVGGQIVGGYVCKRAKLKVRGMLIWCASCAILSAMLTSLFWLHCGDAPIAGVNRAFGNTSIPLLTKNLDHGCNAQCGCSERVHVPICGEDNLEYLTPCHAGCMGERTEDNEKFYFNCSCVKLTQGGSGTGTASSGRCDNGNCIEFYVAMVLIFLLVFTLLLDWAPRVTVTLRCVPDSQRTYGLGVQWVFVRLLGTVPGPIAFGAIMDLACKHHRLSCDDVDVCAIYNRYELSRNAFLLAFFFKTLTSVCYVLALLLYRPSQTVDNSNATGTQRANDSNTDVTLHDRHESSDMGVVNRAFRGGSEAEYAPSEQSASTYL